MSGTGKGGHGQRWSRAAPTPRIPLSRGKSLMGSSIAIRVNTPAMDLARLTATLTATGTDQERPDKTVRLDSAFTKGRCRPPKPR